jgi:heat shock protein HslJ
MNSLDYHGTYKGILPCADCEALETTITLTADAYTKETVYKGKSREVFKETGKYTWNDAGNTITLSDSEAPNQYFVGENVLFHLDAEGKRIEGDLASNYKLSRIEISEPIAPAQKEEIKTKEVAKIELKNSKWRLVKLHGQPFVKNKEIKKEIGITFTVDGRFSAFAGCNNMMGSYKLKEDVSRIEFSKAASTMMACGDMLTEQELAKVLQITDNYNFDGKTLKLNKGRMATLAEFEIIK